MNAPPPLLLVSVRSAAEAREAILGGADIIDVKEPSRGALGAADDATLLEIANKVQASKPLSAAMGELMAFDEGHSLDAIEEYRWLKFGMTGCTATSNWGEKWQRMVRLFAGKKEPVVAAYADHDAAGCQSPLEIASSLRLSGSIFLLDTFVKNGRSVFEIFSVEKLISLRIQLNSLGARFALAGSLRGEDAERIIACAPDIVGIRGAACVAGRTGQISTARVRDFRDALHRASRANPAPLQAIV